MRLYRSAVAPWRAVLLAVVVLAGGISAANAAAPADLGRHPYVVLVDNSSAAQAVAKDHSRRFGVTVDTVFDRVRGYAGSMTDRAANELARQPGVLVARDTAVSAFEDASESPQILSGQPYGSPADWGWGLGRIDQKKRLPANNEYHYSETGDGVTAYVIDTGVNMNHEEFVGGRATAGYDAFRAPGHADYGQDCDGHGTHVAGILGGATFGVAKKVKIVSVRVLDCRGSGTVSNVVAGIEWVTKNAVKPAVANMSLGGSTNSVLDGAVRNSIASGVTYSLAAGNEGQDACRVSPARVKEALTVGATDAADKRTSWSNYGSSCVDVYAPGNNIVSAYGATGSSKTAWQKLSGTSMAAPAVAGVAALLLDLASTSKVDAATVGKALAGIATSDAVTGSNTSGAKLLYAPWQDPDLTAAGCLLGTVSGTACDPSPSPPAQNPPPPAQNPPPPPPQNPPTTRPCFILCLR